MFDDSDGGGNSGGGGGADVEASDVWAKDRMFNSYFEFTTFSLHHHDALR